LTAAQGNTCPAMSISESPRSGDRGPLTVRTRVWPRCFTTAKHFQEAARRPRPRTPRPRVRDGRRRKRPPEVQEGARSAEFNAANNNMGDRPERASTTKPARVRAAQPMPEINMDLLSGTMPRRAGPSVAEPEDSSPSCANQIRVGAPPHRTLRPRSVFGPLDAGGIPQRASTSSRRASSPELQPCDAGHL